MEEEEEEEYEEEDDEEPGQYEKLEPDEDLVVVRQCQEYLERREQLKELDQHKLRQKLKQNFRTKLFWKRIQIESSHTMMGKLTVYLELFGILSLLRIVFKFLGILVYNIMKCSFIASMVLSLVLLK